MHLNCLTDHSSCTIIALRTWPVFVLLVELEVTTATVLVNVSNKVSSLVLSVNCTTPRLIYTYSVSTPVNKLLHISVSLDLQCLHYIYYYLLLFTSVYYLLLFTSVYYLLLFTTIY